MPTLRCCRDGRLPSRWLRVTPRMYGREVELLGPPDWTTLAISRTNSIHEFATSAPDSTMASVASGCTGSYQRVFDHLNWSSTSWMWRSFYMIVCGWVDALMLCINGCAACWKEVLLSSNLNVENCVYISNFQAHIVGIAISHVVQWVKCLCNHYSNKFKVECS